MPTTANHPDEVSVFIELSPDDGDLDSFLRSEGVAANKTHGVFNAIPQIVQQALEHPARYVYTTGAASVLMAALRAYAQTHQRRLVVRKSKSGVTVEASNFTPKELKELEIFDIFEFEIKADAVKKPKAP
jgi:hypothetical protein